ncbi:uncharacterized protein LOC100161080 [Acyrthosiphon pisum]|uniref:Uncharacterized protein n=1 Tax=Acyrthosiphon pisum TaxID=7029 RepID=A0A8R1W3Z3_ACYPI|nr:uncharacterized protein LOC100161080 [Acyrthosiphon pisum]|eukprot:XP_001944106.1 PREDICTED: uncharacterized protein LOC100161080 [Acyrthosiphon pisum]
MDTATFFVEGTANQFEHVLSLYPQALRIKAEAKTKKPEDLIKLDNWYQNELPGKIKSRGKDAHLNHEEICQIMKWKQTRGKTFPQLNYLIKVNTPRAVMAETKKAFKKLPNLGLALTALSNLKGVGTTMASALLAAAAPDKAPFMADECLKAIPAIEGIDYTAKEYLNFVAHIQQTVERLNGECSENTWNPHSVELALWTHYVANEFKPELLSSVPEPIKKPIISEQTNTDAHTNGSVNQTELDEPTSDESNPEPLPPSNGHQLTIEDDSRDKSEDDITNDSITTSESAQTPLAEALTEDSSSLPAPDEPPVKKFKTEGQTVAAEANGN